MMTSVPDNPAAAELLAEFSSATNGAALLLNSGIDEDSLGEVRAALHRMGPQSSLSVILNSPGGGSVTFAG